MIALLLVSLAVASPEDRIARLYEKQDWEKVVAVCTEGSTWQTDDTPSRTMCADAWLRHSPPADNVTAQLQFSERWTSTPSAAITFARAAELALPPESATEAQLLRHSRKFADTEAAATSWARAESVAHQTAREVDTFAGWVQVLERYPEGRLVADARKAALAVGIREASAAGERQRWQDLLDRLPESEAAIRRAGETAAVRVVSASLAGACWDVPCAVIPQGERVVLPNVDLPWNAHLTARWVALDARGAVLSDDRVAAGLGLTADELDSITKVAARLGVSMWTAPVDWALPPATLNARWALQLRIGQSDPLLRPAQLQAHWLPAGPGGIALVHHGSDGLVVQGSAVSLVWSTEKAPAPGDRGATVAATPSHIFFRSERDVHVVATSGGPIDQLALEGAPVGLRPAGDRVRVELEEGFQLCDVDSCTSKSDRPVHAVSESTGRYLVRESDPTATRWIVHAPQGKILASSRMPASNGGDDGVGSFDVAGEKVLVVHATDHGKSHLLRVFDATSGSIEAEKRFATEGSSYAAMTAEGLRQVLPTLRPDSWVVDTVSGAGGGVESVGVRMSSGRFIVQDVDEYGGKNRYVAFGEAAPQGAALRDALLSTRSPDGRGHVDGTTAVLPSGRSVRLSGTGDFVWIQAPLSVRLLVEK